MPLTPADQPASCLRQAQAAAARAWRLAGLTLAVAMALLAGCASAPPAMQPVARGDDAAVVAQLRTLIAHELRQSRAAGLSIALVQGPQLGDYEPELQAGEVPTPSWGRVRISAG